MTIKFPVHHNTYTDRLYDAGSMRITEQKLNALGTELEDHQAVSSRWNIALQTIGRLVGLHVGDSIADSVERVCALVKEVEDLKLQLSVVNCNKAAYLEGQDVGVEGVAMRWRQALEKPIPTPGVMNEPLESLYRRTEALRLVRTAAEDLLYWNYIKGCTCDHCDKFEALAATIRKSACS